MSLNIFSSALTTVDWNLFFSTFALIFIAELPDKTAFATVLMATKGSPWPIFIGACAAFFIQSLVAVAFGDLISLFPEKWVHLAAGVMFLVFSYMALKRSQNISEDNKIVENKSKAFWLAVWSSFMVIFIAEWGDLTQLATASLVAREHKAVTIFVGATLALWAVTGLAIVVGSHAKKIFRPILLNRVAAATFAAVGLYFIVSFTRT